MSKESWWDSPGHQRFALALLMTSIFLPPAVLDRLGLLDWVDDYADEMMVGIAILIVLFIIGGNVLIRVWRA